MAAGRARRLILARHAQPAVDPTMPPGQWPLTEAGRAASRQLAPLLASHDPDLVFTSRERKAVETGAVIASVLGLESGVLDGVQEQGGNGLPFFESEAAFKAAVREHFVRSDEAVLGDESARDAANRFERALVGIEWNVVRLPVIVTHGRVMSSFLARLTGRDPVALWPLLTLPDAYLADLDSKRAVRIAR